MPHLQDPALATRDVRAQNQAWLPDPQSGSLLELSAEEGRLMDRLALALQDMELALRKTVAREVNEQIPITHLVFKEWDEASHPRGDAGRFVSSAGIEVTENHNSTKGEYLFAGNDGSTHPSLYMGPQVLTHHASTAQNFGTSVHAVTAQINSPAPTSRVENAQDNLGLSDDDVKAATGLDPQEVGTLAAAMHPDVGAALRAQGYDGAVGHLNLDGKDQPVHVAFSGTQITPAATQYTAGVGKDGAPVEPGTRFMWKGNVGEVTDHRDPDDKGRAQVAVTYHHPTDPDKSFNVVAKSQNIGGPTTPRLADYDERYYVSAEAHDGGDFGMGSEHPSYSSAVGEARGMVENEGAARAYVWPATHDPRSDPGWGQNRMADTRGDMVHQVTAPGLYKTAEVPPVVDEMLERRKLWEAARDAEPVEPPLERQGWRQINDGPDQSIS